MRRNWTREEFLLCLVHYGSLSISARRSLPAHIANSLATITGRSVSSIELRFANFNALDPEYLALGLKGMNGGGEACKAIWDEFSRPDGTLDFMLLSRQVSIELFKS